MAICTWCEQEMLEASSCSVEELHLGGIPIPLLRYGRESRFRSRRPVRCGDCGVRAGGYHHLGCDLAECPSCGQQLLSCECRYDEQEETADRPGVSPGEADVLVDHAGKAESTEVGQL